MKYVYVQNGAVTDAVRVDPFTIFAEGYASQFVEAPDEVESGWLVTKDGYEAPKTL